jgi:hypothetical protein
MNGGTFDINGNGGFNVYVHQVIQEVDVKFVMHVKVFLARCGICRPMMELVVSMYSPPDIRLKMRK